MIKSRHLSFEEALQALEDEFICAKIRFQIYALNHDKRHWEKVMDAKKSKIKNLGLNKDLETMFDQIELEEEAWKRIVPEFGFPHFIYNEKFQENDRKFTFPYSGTVVETCDGKYGHSDFVENGKIQIRIGKEFFEYHLDEVKRLGPKETDMYYYYTPGAKFRTPFSESCMLKGVDLRKGVASFGLTKNKFSFSEISRIL